MHKAMWKYLILLLVIPGLLVTVSCAKKAVQSQPVVTGPSADEQAAMQAAAEREAKEKAEMERQKRLAEEKQMHEQALMDAQHAAEQAKMEAKTQFLNDDVHFDFDSDTLNMDAQDLLKDKAQWLMDNPDAHIVIEGNCDERGTNAYNLALGDRRAQAVKNFLVTLGVSSTRLTTISYGEERPLDPAHNEAAWAKNRRVHFVLQ
jgi:peptidoglycan-associated lipoprotein